MAVPAMVDAGVLRASAATGPCTTVRVVLPVIAGFPATVAVIVVVPAVLKMTPVAVAEPFTKTALAGKTAWESDAASNAVSLKFVAMLPNASLAMIVIVPGVPAVARLAKDVESTSWLAAPAATVTMPAPWMEALLVSVAVMVRLPAMVSTALNAWAPLSAGVKV